MGIMDTEHIVILHDIRSAENVGAIFRTADAAGISKIYLTGYTPTPLDRFGRKRKDVAKAALGAEESVSWEQHPDIVALIEKLKKDGVQIIAVEQAENSVDYKSITIKESAAFIFGNEVTGIPSEILEKADVIAEIPMYGKKESLNVSVSAGVILFNSRPNN